MFENHEDSYLSVKNMGDHKRKRLGLDGADCDDLSIRLAVIGVIFSAQNGIPKTRACSECAGAWEVEHQSDYDPQYSNEYHNNYAVEVPEGESFVCDICGKTHEAWLDTNWQAPNHMPKEW